MRLPPPTTSRGAAVRLSVALFVCLFAAQSAFLVPGAALAATPATSEAT